MMKHWPIVDILHYQGKTKYCTAYSLVHALSAFCKHEYYLEFASVDPYSLLWRASKYKGWRSLFNRAFNLPDLVGAVNMYGIALSAKNDGKRGIFEINRVDIVEEVSWPKTEDIKRMLADSPVIVYSDALHAVVIVSYDEREKEFTILDSLKKGGYRRSPERRWFRLAQTIDVHGKFIPHPPRR